MKSRSFQVSLGCFLVIFFLAGCRSSATPSPSMVPTPIQIQPSPTFTVSLPTATPNPFPLSGPGPYAVGVRSISAIDPERDDRSIKITLWYPAAKGSGADLLSPIRDAEADSSAAPYPVILSSTKFAEFFAPVEVSHGFTWASVDDMDTYFAMSRVMIDQPLDILFTLNYVAQNPPAGLEGVIDSDHAGVTGYSFDGYNSYAVSGARVDENYYRAQCPEPDEITKSILGDLSVFGCYALKTWDNFTSHSQKFIEGGEDGLWLPMTDERIQAVIPLAGEGWWLFGERGLAAVKIPILILVGEKDELYPENAFIYEKLGSADKSFLTFVGQSHMMIHDDEIVKIMSHFEVAFFSYYLKGQQEYKQYFNEEFVNQFSSLAWGPVPEK